ncbi:predicted protein, partial [Postia placenta Mad-698-R]
REGDTASKFRVDVNDITFLGNAPICPVNDAPAPSADNATRGYLLVGIQIRLRVRCTDQKREASTRVRMIWHLFGRITIRPRDGVAIAPYVLFTEIQFPSAAAGALQQVSPEIYARPDNEVYCCGPGDNSRVPETVDDVEVDQSACESIREHVASISAELRDGAVDKRQACFLPVVSTGGGPIVGEATSIAKGLVIATGHTCWVGILALAAPLLAATDVFSDWGFLQGICNAPGTAKAVAELVMEGKIKARARPPGHRRYIPYILYALHDIVTAHGGCFLEAALMQKLLPSRYRRKANPREGERGM